MSETTVPTATTDDQDLTRLLTDLFTGTFGADPARLTPQTTLEALDLDSLVLVELAVILERRLGIRLAEGELRVSQTVAEAAAVVAAKAGRA